MYSSLLGLNIAFNGNHNMTRVLLKKRANQKVKISRWRLDGYQAKVGLLQFSLNNNKIIDFHLLLTNQDIQQKEIESLYNMAHKKNRPIFVQYLSKWVT